MGAGLWIGRSDVLAGQGHKGTVITDEGQVGM